MRVIPLIQAPQQSLTVRGDGSRWVLTLKCLTGSGSPMVVDIERDAVMLVTGQRCLAGEPLIPFTYIETGNFIFQTLNDELPDWTQFGNSQLLFYLSVAEVEALKATPVVDTTARIPAGTGFLQPTPRVLTVAPSLITGDARTDTDIEVSVAGVLYTPTVGMDGTWSFDPALSVPGTYPIAARYTAPVPGPFSAPPVDLVIP